MEWQPIATAPRDGTEVLAFERLASGDYYKVMLWDDHGTDLFSDDVDTRKAGWVEAGDGYVGAFNPTHWMPLPDPPQQIDRTDASGGTSSRAMKVGSDVTR